MTRWRSLLLAALGVLALASTHPVSAQQGKKRIAYLANNPEGKSISYRAFERKLRELGWSEDRLHISIRAAGTQEQFKAHAANAAREGYDVIVTTGSVSTRGAMEGTSSVPIVFASVALPNEQKLVGKNAVGVKFAELEHKRVELLHQLVPNAKTIARLYDPTSISEPDAQRRQMQDADRAASTLKMSVVHIPVTSMDEVRRVYDTARENGIGGIVLTRPPLFVKHRKELARIAARLPTVSADIELVNLGGAIAYYGDDIEARYSIAAELVHEVLSGTPLARIKVHDPPHTLVFACDRRLAEDLGVTVPRELPTTRTCK